MLVWYQQLPVKTKDRLHVAQRQGGFGRGSFFKFTSRRWLLWMGLAALIVGGGCLATAVSMFQDPHFGRPYCAFPGSLAFLGLLYGLIAL